MELKYKPNIMIDLFYKYSYMLMSFQKIIGYVSLLTPKPISILVFFF